MSNEELTELRQALLVFSDISQHIIYDKNIKDICYSSSFVKAKRILVETGRKVLENEIKSK